MQRSTGNRNASVVALLCGRGLRRQLIDWRERAPNRRCTISNATRSGYVRSALREADVALVDATVCPALALDMSSLLIDRLGAGAVAVYTETLHDGLEVNVRQQGSWLLLGPLREVEWDELLDRMTQIVKRKKPAAEAQPAQRRQPAEPRATRAAVTTRRQKAGGRRRRTHA